MTAGTVVLVRRHAGPLVSAEALSTLAELRWRARPSELRYLTPARMAARLAQQSVAMRPVLLRLWREGHPTTLAPDGSGRSLRPGYSTHVLGPDARCPVCRGEGGHVRTPLE